MGLESSSDTRTGIAASGQYAALLFGPARCALFIGVVTSGALWAGRRVLDGPTPHRGSVTHR